MDVLRLIQEEDDYQIIIRCDDISYAWEKFRGRINYANSLRQDDDIVEPNKYCSYSSSDNCRLELFDYEKGQLKPLSDGIERHWDKVWPVVYETCDYNIAIRFKPGFIDGGTQPCVRHVRRDVESLFYVDRIYEGEGVIGLSGSISFLNEPGLFKLEFEYQHGGRKYVAWLTFDVVSPKLDIKTDYKKLLKDVNDEYNDVIYRYLSTTYQQLARGRVKNDVVWMNIFENIIADYLKNVEIIINRPHQKVRNYTTYVKVEQIKKWTPALEDEYEEKRIGKRLEDYYFEYKDSETTINTKENRFVKHTLGNIAYRLNRILEDVLNQDCNKNLSEKHRQDLTSYRKRLQKLVKHPFFRAVGRFEGLNQDSLVLQNRLGYQQVYKDWIKLNRGIDLYKGASNIGTLQIWEIYELWCFIKMKRMIKQLLHIDSSDYENLVSEPKGSLFNPFTNSKMEHIVKFEYPVPLEDDDSEWAEQMRSHKGDVVTLHYQHTFNRLNNDDYGVHTATTEQRPDVVLNIEKKDGSGILLTYLYDAKYRVINDKKLDKDDMDIADVDDIAKGADLPPRDAINQMHRYRDAIYYGQDKNTQSSKEIIGGYILFPGRGDDVSIRNSYYSNSVRSVNIGAFPLLPKFIEHDDSESHEEDDGILLYEHLKDILLYKRLDTDYVESAVPQRGLYYTDDGDVSIGNRWKNDKVLVIIDTNSQHWNRIDDISKYAIGLDMVPPALKVASEFSEAKYLLITNRNINCTRLYKIKHCSYQDSITEDGHILSRKDNAPAIEYYGKDNYKEKIKNSILSYLIFEFEAAHDLKGQYPIDVDKVDKTILKGMDLHELRVVLLGEIVKFN